MNKQNTITKTALKTSVLIISSLLANSNLYAADLEASSVIPEVYFEDTTPATAVRIWSLRAQQNQYFKLLDRNNPTSHDVLNIFGAAGNTNNENSLIVDSSGDINLANGSVFIDRSLNSMGIGTVAPSEELTISSASPTIELRDTSNPGLSIGPRTWEINSNPDSGTFDIANTSDDNQMFRLSYNAPDNSIVANSTGVGIWTGSPTAKLDVRGDIKATFSGPSTSGLQELFVMSANNTTAGTKSDAGFVLENARAGFSWAFRTDENNGGFSASKQATGAREFELINTTGVASNVELRLANGGANVNGTWVNASSRSYKKNIQELSSKDAMQAMRGLKSVQYQFKSDNEHKLGFIAEDVPAMVATRGRKTLDPMQIVAVLTKAVQEQDKALLRNREAALSKDKKIAQLQRKVDHLETVESRLTELEAMILKLSSGFKSQPDNFASIN